MVTVTDVADRPRFGPAGVPGRFKELKRSVDEFPAYLHAEGLDAFEYQAVRWGPRPQMRREGAEKLGNNAKKYDVWLTVHGSYFINFCGNEETIEKSKKRLIACATAADWMDAHLVVFHPGFYGKRSPRDALKICAKAMEEVVESVRSLGITKVHLGPETTGKPSQLGSLDEILTLCERVELTEPVIDWAHIHAREGGKLKTIDDFREVLNQIEKRLGDDALKNLHCHYTPVEFTAKGERRHRTMDETEFGPEFRHLAVLIAELDLKPIIISESPILDIDSQKMRDIVYEELRKRGKAIA